MNTWHDWRVWAIIVATALFWFPVLIHVLWILLCVLIAFVNLFLPRRRRLHYPNSPAESTGLTGPPY